MGKKLSIKEAYNTMIDFLDQFYEKTYSDDLGSLLGGMTLLEDGMPIDKAVLEDWRNSVDKFKLDGKQQLTLKSAYQAMIDYLTGYSKRITSKEIDQILKEIILIYEGGSTVGISWNNWLVSVNNVLSRKK